MNGRTLAHYEISEQIGAGGMGEVFRARDKKLGRDVALKILPDSFASDAERLSRFEREAKLLAGLNHSNIAAIYGIEEADSQRFLVLELVEGVDLAKRLAEGPLLVEDALAIAYQIAEALEVAHEQGVVHRDLKPANVVVSPGGTVKVLDFGLAKALEVESGSGHLSHSPTVLASSPTVQGLILGTAAYMSPEQARGKAVDRRADIWAFGVVLYEMLTGRQLYAGETVSDTLASVIKSKPDWDALPKETPRAILHLLERCLDKDARTRLRDIGEARVIIDRVLRGEIAEEAAAPAVVADRGRLRIGWIAATIVLAAVAAAAAWIFKPGAPDPPLRKFSLVVESEAGASPEDPVISPDGSRIAYELDGKLYVQELDQLKPRQIPTETGADKPFWSPDGVHIGYIGGGDLWKVPTSGGTSVRVCDPAPSFTGGRGASWSHDGRIVFTHGSGPIFEVSANGGDPSIYVPLEENDADFHEPSPLPDGKGWLYVVHPKNSPPDKIEVFAEGVRKQLIDTGGFRVANPIYSPSGHLVFYRAGTNAGVWAVPFSLSSLEVTGEPYPIASEAGNPSVSEDGTFVFLRGASGQQLQLLWVTRDGDVSEPISEVTASFYDPVLSPDLKHLAVGEWDGEKADIWIHDLERKTRTRFTFEDGGQGVPEWSPDGTEIFYGDARSDSIYSRNADGTGSPRSVVKGRAPCLSRDGRYLAYHIQAGSPNQEDLWYLDLSDEESSPKEFLSTSAREYRARISPDGRYLAYESNESGTFEIFITRFPEGTGKWQVSTNGGTRPRWGRSGKTIYYQEEFCDLMEVSVQTEPSLMLGTPQKLIDCSEFGLWSGQGREFAVEGDGERFIWSRSAEVETGRIDVGITVVENWIKEFEK